MSVKKARYIGHPDGVDLSIPFRDGDVVNLHVAHGAELPTEVGGRSVPAAFRDSLLEQEDNWSEVKRATGSEATGKTDTKDDGIGSQFGAKKESTWGTAVTVDKFFEFESESLSLDRTYYDGLGLRAGRTFAPSNRTKATTRTAGGDLSVVFPQKLGGFFLDLMVAPTITPGHRDGTAYNSTFNIGASVPTKSATLQVNKPTTQGVDTAFTYPGSDARRRRSAWRSAAS
jgi:hypothetical protein